MSFRLQLLLARARPRRSVVREKSFHPNFMRSLCLSASQTQSHSHLCQLAVIARFTFHRAGELQCACYFPALWISLCSESFENQASFHLIRGLRHSWENLFFIGNNLTPPMCFCSSRLRTISTFVTISRCILFVICAWMWEKLKLE